MFGLFARATICALLVLAAIAASSSSAAPPNRPGIAGTGLTDWEFFEHALSASSVRLCWGGEDRSPYTSWNVRMAPGTTPPPADAPSTTVPGDADGACYTATGLATDEPYTFRITGNGPSGESGPAFHTLAARVPGVFVLNGSARETFPWDTDLVDLAVSGDRRWHAIFPYAQKTDHGTFAWTFYSTRGPSGWTKPELVAGSLDAVLAAGSSTVAVTWSDPLSRYQPRYRFRAARASAFGARHSLPTVNRRNSVFASALDRRGRLHVLSYGRRTDGAAVYSSNRSGKWRKQLIAGAWGCESASLFGPCPQPPLLAYDRASDRIVVVSQGRNNVRMTSKRASASRFGALHSLTSVNKRHLTATGLTSRGNHVTLALAPRPAAQVFTAPTGPFDLWSDGQIVRVPGTTADDQHLLVAASSPSRVKLAWQRDSATWDRSQQGVWTAESVRNSKTGRWSIQNITHRSDSHYDKLDSLAVTGAGRALIAYMRAGQIDTP